MPVQRLLYVVYDMNVIMLVNCSTTVLLYTKKIYVYTLTYWTYYVLEVVHSVQSLYINYFCKQKQFDKNVKCAVCHN